MDVKPFEEESPKLGALVLWWVSTGPHGIWIECAADGPCWSRVWRRDGKDGKDLRDK